MKVLYCPWRESYSKKVDNAKGVDALREECVFCNVVKQKDADDKNYVLKRFDRNLLMLNLYPYNAGHLLIIPYCHTQDLQSLSPAARAEMIEIAARSSELLKNSLGAQGINLGLNQGREAGAGIPSHVHMHVLPRWRGDTNFMPLLAETKHISFDLNTIYSKLKKALYEFGQN